MLVNTEELMGLREAAAVADVPHTRLWRHAKAGKLRCVRIGGHLYFRRADVLAWAGRMVLAR